MSDEKTLIILPEDETLNFLHPIVDHILQELPSRLVDFFAIAPTEESHKKVLKEIKSSSITNILFLGHGCSRGLFGARDANYKNDKFINTQNFSIFENKKLILVSCESADLLKQQKKSGFEEGLGFGDLPTDATDIQSAIELDNTAYAGFSDELLWLFKSSLVEIVKYSFTDYITNNLSLTEFQSLVLLRINKRISKFFLLDNSKYSPLNDVLFRMKKEIRLVRKAEF